MVMPVAMTGLSVYGIASAFGAAGQALLPVGAWLAAAVLIAGVALLLQPAAPQGTLYESKSRCFYIPGSARFNHLAGHLDGVVGTSHLAQTASYTPMFIFIIMGHGRACHGNGRRVSMSKRFSGYCSVVFRRQNTVMVVFIPISREVTPCMSPPI